jgi:hypothetical protein
MLYTRYRHLLNIAEYLRQKHLPLHCSSRSRCRSSFRYVAVAEWFVNGCILIISAACRGAGQGESPDSSSDGSKKSADKGGYLYSTWRTILASSSNLIIG